MHAVSHRMPTPRGGGIAIALVTTVGLLVLALRGSLDVGLLGALAVGGLAVAAVGLCRRLSGAIFFGQAHRAFQRCDLGRRLAWRADNRCDSVTISFDLGWVGDLLAVVRDCLGPQPVQLYGWRRTASRLSEAVFCRPRRCMVDGRPATGARTLSPSTSCSPQPLADSCFGTGRQRRSFLVTLAAAIWATFIAVTGAGRDAEQSPPHSGLG